MDFFKEDYKEYIKIFVANPIKPQKTRKERPSQVIKNYVFISKEKTLV